MMHLHYFLKSLRLEGHLGAGCLYSPDCLEGAFLGNSGLKGIKRGLGCSRYLSPSALLRALLSGGL